MTKQEQIEEMVNISTKEEIEARNKRDKEKDELRQALLHYATAEASGGIKSLIDCEGCAFYLYENLGYRKLPENSIVLSREEHEILVKTAQGKIGNMKATDFIRACISSGVMVEAVSTKEQVRQAVKEFAEELKAKTMCIQEYADGTRILETSNKLIDQSVKIFLANY